MYTFPGFVSFHRSSKYLGRLGSSISLTLANPSPSLSSTPGVRAEGVRAEGPGHKRAGQTLQTQLYRGGQCGEIYLQLKWCLIK